MSAMRAKPSKRAPRFSHYVDIDVDIEPEDLERAGWVYVGKGDETALPTESVLDVVKAWHDEAHETNWRWCQHEPCHSLNREQGPL